MKDIDAAWLAGYIDGDGCISLCASRNRHGNVGRRIPHVAVDSCDIELLERVKSLVGAGHIVQKASRTKSPHHRPAWHWKIRNGPKVLALLREIAPYLRCVDKKRRAELLIDRWESCTSRNGWYTPEQSAMKTKFEEDFLAIGHRRGIRERLGTLTVLGAAT